jgi:hypothetical protein
MKEYDFEIIPLTEEQKVALEFQRIDESAIAALLKSVINERAQDGWSPLYPFSFPVVWFEKTHISAPVKKPMGNS